MSESTYQIIIIVGMLIPVVGGALTAIFRILGWGRAASIVEALQPLALRAAHEAATKPASDKPEPPKAPPGSLIMCLGMLFALVAFGCGAMQKVEHVVQMSSEVIARAEPCLMLQYEQAQVECLDLESTDAARACVDSVKATWKPIIDALGELRDVRCGLEPAKCEAGK